MKQFCALIFSLIVITSCKKEKSLEAPPPGHGSLISLAGECLGSMVKGSYQVNKTLNDSNYVLVAVRVIVKGTYNISTTNVLNGYSFSGSGVFSDTGIVQVKLQATGVPTLAQTDHFTLLLDTSLCDFEVIVSPPGTGTGSCNATVGGSYNIGVPLSSSNTVTLQHSFTTAGTYNVTTDTVNGYSFNKTVVVTTPGMQTITLDGAGTPANAQTDNFTVKFGDGGSCNFSVNVSSAPAAPEYYPLTSNSWWSYDNLLSPPDTITRLVSGIKAIAGSTYTRILQKNNAGVVNDSLFIRKNLDNYYEYGVVDKYSSNYKFDVPQSGDILFLKASQPAGTVWYSSIYSGLAGGNPVQIQYKFTVVNPDASITIGGRTYNNVYQLTMVPERNTGSGFTAYAHTWTFYYARNVGLIYSKLMVGTGTFEEYQLRNWQIF